MRRRRTFSGFRSRWITLLDQQLAFIKKKKRKKERKKEIIKTLYPILRRIPIGVNVSQAFQQLHRPRHEDGRLQHWVAVMEVIRRINVLVEVAVAVFHHNVQEIHRVQKYLQNEKR
jgi:hypothetical protein